MFKSTPAADGVAPATGAKSGPFSLIGGDVVITGEVSASVDLHIDGRIDGDVTCATLVQGPDSVIRGNVVAKAARISGTVEGSITADELIVERSARISGDCTYAAITVANGAKVDGRLNSRGGGVPELKVVGG